MSVQRAVCRLLARNGGRSRLTPDTPDLLERWNAGCRDALRLFREIHPQGDPGSDATVARDAQHLRQATDHKRIALLYLTSITLFFFLGGVAAVMMRLELLTPPGDLVLS